MSESETLSKCSIAMERKDPAQKGVAALMYVKGPAPECNKFPLFEDIWANMRSGCTLGLVNLPLSVSLSIAYGGTPEMGAVSAFWGSLVGGVVNGSQFSLHAPTGGLSGVLGGYAEKFGPQCLPILALLSSFISFLCWKFKLHSFLTVFPACGMMGFKFGIGVIIALNQLNFALGLDPNKIENWQKHEHWYQRIIESFRQIEHTKAWNPVLFILTCLPLYFLTAFSPKCVKNLPWHIIFVVIGIVIGYILDEVDNDFDILLLKDRFEINPYIVGYTKDTVFWAGFEGADWAGLVGASISVSVIAILETQIAAKIADVATGTQFDSKREVLGTCFSNLFCGLAGGVPVCGAMARMTLNINTGARSRTSLVINAFVVLIMTFGLFPFFKFLPQPVIGAVLVPVALSMIKIAVYTHYWKNDTSSFLQCITVFLVCVFVDPTYAIICAILLGTLREAGNMRIVAPGDYALFNVTMGQVEAGHNFSQLDSDGTSVLHNISKDKDLLVVYRPLSNWTFTNNATHSDRIAALQKRGKHVMISLRHLRYMDLDGLDSLRDIYGRFQKADLCFIVCEYDAVIQAKLERYEWFHSAVSAGKAYKELKQALTQVVHTQVVGPSMASRWFDGDTSVRSTDMTTANPTSPDQEGAQMSDEVIERATSFLSQHPSDVECPRKDVDVGADAENQLEI